MEVLLLTDILGIGKKNDLIVVKSGFALNCLLPGGKALVVTPNVRKRYAAHIKARALEREKEKDIVSAIGAALSGKTLHLKAKVSKTGKLYAGITESVIAEAIKNEFGMKIAPDTISLQNPIKTTGVHPIDLTAGAQVIKMTVDVSAEEDAPKAKAAA